MSGVVVSVNISTGAPIFTAKLCGLVDWLQEGMSVQHSGHVVLLHVFLLHFSPPPNKKIWG